MSYQDTLMNVVYLVDDEEPRINIYCSWCDNDTGSDGLIGWRDNIDDANNMKITHENDHGIYSDPDTGELYHDPEDSYI